MNGVLLMVCGCGGCLGVDVGGWVGAWVGDTRCWMVFVWRYIHTYMHTCLHTYTYLVYPPPPPPPPHECVYIYLHREGVHQHCGAIS